MNVLEVIAQHLGDIASMAARLERIELHQLDLERKIMSALADLQAAVANEDTVIDSAITLIRGIPALISAAGTDGDALLQLQADITAKATALAAAIVAGTPAAPAPAPAPVDPTPPAPPPADSGTGDGTDTGDGSTDPAATT